MEIPRRQFLLSLAASGIALKALAAPAQPQFPDKSLYWEPFYRWDLVWTHSRGQWSYLGGIAATIDPYGNSNILFRPVTRPERPFFAYDEIGIDQQGKWWTVEQAGFDPVFRRVEENSRDYWACMARNMYRKAILRGWPSPRLYDEDLVRKIYCIRGLDFNEIRRQALARWAFRGDAGIPVVTGDLAIADVDVQEYLRQMRKRICGVFRMPALPSDTKGHTKNGSQHSAESEIRSMSG